MPTSTNLGLFGGIREGIELAPGRLQLVETGLQSSQGAFHVLTDWLISIMIFYE